MDELETIAETLRRQRKDLEEQTDQTLSRRAEAAELFEQIEDLRRRADETQRRFRASVTESRPKTGK